MTIITLRTPEESDIRRSQSMYEISRIDVRDIVSPGLLFDGSGFNYFFWFFEIGFFEMGIALLVDLCYNLSSECFNLLFF